MQDIRGTHEHSMSIQKDHESKKSKYERLTHAKSIICGSDHILKNIAIIGTTRATFFKGLGPDKK